MKPIRILALLLALTLCGGCAAADIPPQQDAPAATEGPAADVPAADAPIAEGTPLFLFSDTLSAVRTRIEKNAPVAVFCRQFTEGGGTGSPLYGREAVDAVFAALAAVTVTGETDVTVADDDRYYAFLFADGTEDAVGFNGGNLALNGRYYTVANTDALDAIAFPATGRDLSLTDTHPDPAYRAFAAAFYEDTPVRLAVALDGGEPVYFKDAEKVKEAFELLRHAELHSCYDDSPAPGADGMSDRPAVTLTFALADGTAFVYELAGRNLVVDFPEPLGTYWYWLGESADGVLAFAKAEAQP